MAKLKVGLIYKEGGLTYKVIKQAEDGSFISKMIDPKEAKEEAEVPKAEQPKATRKTTKK